jgi:serine/threonine-protein kinase
MGVVYRGELLQLRRAVAVKFLHTWIAGLKETVQRFEIEARAMSRLSHPVCVSVIDFGVDQGAPFLVMDYITGPSLREVIDQGPVPMEQAVQICRQLLAGLAHAHGQGIIHRDIKPDNILLSDVTGLGRQPKILDFGVAKLLDMATGLTTGIAIGTPSYMSPEQTSGDPVDARSDLYSTGVVLYELLAGRKPFVAEQMVEIMRLQREGTPTPLRVVAAGRGVSSQLERVVDKALAKSPRERFQTAAEFAAALQELPKASRPVRHLTPPLPKAISPAPEDAATVSERPRRARSRFRVVLWLSVLSLAGVGAWISYARLADRPKTQQEAPLPDGREWVTEPHPMAPENTPAPPNDVAPREVEPVADSPRVAQPEPVRQEVPGVKEVRSLIAAHRWGEAVERLTKLRKQHPDIGYLSYLQGNLYVAKLWCQQGIDAYQDAVAKDATYRNDELLVRGAIGCLVSDRHAYRSMAFLRREVGAAAIPYLEEARKSTSLGISRRSDQLLRALKKGG